MTGQPDARQPRSGQQIQTASSKAARQLALAQLRADAAATKGMQLALLAHQYAGKIAAAQQQHRGAALVAALAAISAEQRAAERALVAKLNGEATARRKAMVKEYNAKDRSSRAVQYRAAAAEATTRRAAEPARPRDRQRSTRTPRLRR